MTSLPTALGVLKVQSHAIERRLARHLSRHVDALWADIVTIIHRKPFPVWEREIVARHAIYVVLAYAEYERQMVRVVEWQRGKLRVIFARRFPWLKSGSSIESTMRREDIGPLTSLAVVLSLASDTIKKWLAGLGLLRLGWFTGTRAGTAKPLLQSLKKGMAKPQATAEEVVAAIKPKVQQVKNSLNALARTAVAKVNTESVVEASYRLGCVGFQINGILDDRIRLKHFIRSGMRFYIDPEEGELGLEKMPLPPYEADGSLAYNCRCYLVPLWQHVDDAANSARESACSLSSCTP